MKNGKNLDLYWMDGGITPERPVEIEPDVNMNDVMGNTGSVGILLNSPIRGPVSSK